jgi:hypothetical protein
MAGCPRDPAAVGASGPEAAPDAGTRRGALAIREAFGMAKPCRKPANQP